MKNSTYLLFIVFSAASLFFIPSLTIAQKDLALYFPFDEGSGKEVKDRSQHKNHGVFKGSPKWVGGKYGSALKFENEGDFVEVAPSESLNIKEKITLMAWGSLDAWKGGGDQWIDRGAHASKGSGYGLMVYQMNTLYFMLGDGGARRDLTIAALPKAKEWHHVAATFDGKEMKVYLNGELLVEKKDAFVFQGVNNLPLVIGAGVERPQYTFEGMIDDVAIYNRALSAAEVKEATKGVSNLLAVESVEKLSIVWGKLKQNQ